MTCDTCVAGGVNAFDGVIMEAAARTADLMRIVMVMNDLTSCGCVCCWLLCCWVGEVEREKRRDVSEA